MINLGSAVFADYWKLHKRETDMGSPREYGAWCKGVLILVVLQMIGVLGLLLARVTSILDPHVFETWPKRVACGLLMLNACALAFVVVLWRGRGQKWSG
jgi:hypothetical protein